MGCIPTRVATRPDPQECPLAAPVPHVRNGEVVSGNSATGPRRSAASNVPHPGRMDLTQNTSSQTDDERTINRTKLPDPGFVIEPATGPSSDLTRTHQPMPSSGSNSPDMAHERLVGRRGTINAETQTSRSPCSTDKREHRWHVGSMALLEKHMQIMLVFTKEDAQSDGFWWAAQRGNFRCDLVQNAETAVENYLGKLHDLVVIDRRQPIHNGFDSDTLCRSLRATKCNEHTIIMAVVKHCEDGNELYTAHDLIRAGFNKRFFENSSTQVCLNELTLIENESFMLRCKLGAVRTLFAALDHSSDAVDICSTDKEIQYVNKSFEKLTGYTADELINCSTKMYLPPGNVAALETALAFLKKGKAWEGASVIENKNGQSVWHHCISVPIMGLKGELSQIVTVRTPLGHNSSENPHSLRESSAPELKNAEALLFGRRDSMRSLPKNFNMLTSAIGPESTKPGHINVRRPSLARIHSMTIEAPITKVINILTTAQQSSPITVSQALDRVLEILHSPELYSLQHAQLFSHSTSPQHLEEDKITSDLVGNLAGINLEHRPSKISMMRKHSIQQSSYELREAHPLLEIPDSVQALIARDANWDFPIFQLEKETHKRPLYYLGIKILQRFRVVEYLGCSDEVLHAWLQMIEAGYKASNLYHNSTHAADVLQATAYFLDNPLIREVMEEHEIVGALIAAIVHDLDHPGRNSAFLCNAYNDLSILYNDKSVLESHHVALAFKLTLKNEQCNIFKNLDRDEFKSLRRVIIDMVLATEMAKHFELLSRFLTFLDRSTTMAKTRIEPAEHLGLDELGGPRHDSSLGGESTYSPDGSRRPSAPNALQDLDLAPLSQPVVSLDSVRESSPPLLTPATSNAIPNKNAGIVINFDAKTQGGEEDVFVVNAQDAQPSPSIPTSSSTNKWQDTLMQLLLGNETFNNSPNISPHSGINSNPGGSVVTSGSASKNRALVLDMLIKCADVSNPCRPLDVCKEWSKRIAEEYFEQTDEEKRLGLPVVMPTFDRHVCNIPQSQVSFIDYFVTGMFEAWDSFCSVPDLMDTLHTNYTYWKELADDIKMKRLTSGEIFDQPQSHQPPPTDIAPSIETTSSSIPSSF